MTAVTADFIVINNNLHGMTKYNNILTLGIKVPSCRTSSSVEYITGRLTYLHLRVYYNKKYVIRTCREYEIKKVIRKA